MTRILVVTPIWKRPHVTHAVLKQWRTWDVPGFSFGVVVVGSEGEKSMAIAKAHDCIYIEHHNLPLGAKFNAGVEFCRDKHFDYLMIMGSDQIVQDSIFEDYRPHIERGERYIGVKDLYVLDMLERSVAYWPGYVGKREGTPIGPGRLMRKDLLEELNYDLYGSTLDKGLDGSMDVRMPACVLISGKEHGMTSIKTRESITKARQYHGSTRVHYGRFMEEHFPEVKL